MRRPSTSIVASALLSAAVLSACSDGSLTPCDTTGTGNITISITGLPAGLNAAVTATGPTDTVAITETTTLTGVSGGRYQFSSLPVVVADSTVSRSLIGNTPSGALCLVDGQSRAVSIPHTQIGSSGKVWVGAGLSLLGYTSAQLVATATIAPNVAAATQGSGGATFDRDGNLWVRGLSASQPYLLRYSAASLASNGNPLPDRSINLTGVTCEGSGGMAFDESGNLWVSIPCQQRVVKIIPNLLGATGVITPTQQITGLVAPDGLAFDGAGNLWVADRTHLRRFDAARLSANITTAADLRVRFTTPSPPTVADTSLVVTNLAFSPTGELWVSSYEDAVLYRVEAAVAAATGAQAAEVTRIIYFNAAAQPRGFAFDNSGGVFIGYVSQSFARLSPAQLATNVLFPSSVTPGKVYASGNIIPFATDVALYPAPAATPLYSRAR